MNWAKTEKILKIGEEILIKELKPWWLIEEISWKNWFLKILVSFNGFGSFFKKGRRRKSFEHLGEFSEISRLDLYGVFGSYRNFKRGIWRSGLHETCSWRKILEFHIRIPKNSFIWPVKVTLKMLVRVWVGLENCFCTPAKNCVFDKVEGWISICLSKKNI